MGYALGAGLIFGGVMTTLREAIGEKIAGLRALVAASEQRIAGERGRQEAIFQAITVEAGRLETLGVYLDEELPDAKAAVKAMLEAYSG